jgi:dCMP deaminase
MKQKYIDLYMAWADRTAKLSHAKRLQVGAVIVKDDSVISYGYNGMPAGWDNNCEDKIFNTSFVHQANGYWVDRVTYETVDDNYMDEQYPYEERSDMDNAVIGRYRLKTKPEVLHAESNAIAKLARSTQSGRDASVFITHAPCLDCAKLIYQSGISNVYYRNSYRDTAGIDFLAKGGISIEQHS